MASKVMKIGLAMVLLATLYSGAMAQSGCTNALTGLSPCINFVTGNSSSPSASCCSGLTSVVRSNPSCLCNLVNGGAAMLGFTVNQTLALQLPNICNVQTPPLSQCNGANGPTSSAPTPGSSPSDSSDDTPEGASTPSQSVFPTGGVGSRTGPSSNGFSIIKNSSNLLLLLLLLFIISFASSSRF